MRCAKRTLTISVLLITVSVVLAQWPAAPGAVAEQNEFGQVDYSQRTVTATGIGAVPTNAPNVGAARANAIRAAKLDALRNLVEAVKSIRISSETTISNNMVTSDIVRTEVEAMVRGARQVGETKYLSDSSVEVTMTVPMTGIMDAVLPSAATAVPPGGAMPPGFETPTATAAPSVSLASPGQPITGLIIDARGLELKPSMSPRILAQDGSILYGPGNYPREFAVAQGVVGYHKDLDGAQKDARVAGNPVIVRGVGKSGTLGTDVIIAGSDAQRVSALDGFDEAIGSCRVMFILD